MKPSPTMEDVARAAGVHQTTVSRALRNDRRLPEATRQRIKTIADEMGYRPNPLLSALGANLRQRRTGEFSATLAYLVRGDGASPRRQEQLAGAMEAASAQGYRLEEFVAGSAGLTPERLNDVLLARNVQGVVVGPQADPREALDLRWSEFCAVSIEYTFSEPRFDRVAHDAFSGMRRIMQECRTRGYRRPGLILSPSVDARGEGQDLAAYLLEQRANAGGTIEPLVVAADAGERIAAWMREAQPDVVITTSELREAIDAAGVEGGTRPGADIGLALIDVTAGDTAAGMLPEWNAIGAIAVQVLIDKINRNERGAPSLFRTLLTPGRWQDGATLPARP